MKKRQWVAALLLLTMLAGCKSPAAESDSAVESSASIEKQAAASSASDAPAAEPEETPILAPPQDPQTFVRVRDYIPDITVDLRYATADNFTGMVIYAYDDAWLRYATVRKLAKAQEQLKAQGYRLCIWDAFRSAHAQQTLWEAYPDGNYVANPANGYSGHTRGDTIDVTLVTLEGEAVEMPSGFDDFSALADRDYRDVSATAAQHAALLESVMASCGFTGYDKEWWHYSDTNRADPDPDFEPAD
ncbi:MAG: M15 family metallopeptidase [Butyricicoccus sp.]|nr:M15 family metallopeptidase [Butyricicoccus sp.]